jgi:hypothetical protein
MRLTGGTDPRSGSNPIGGNDAGNPLEGHQNRKHAVRALVDCLLVCGKVLSDPIDGRFAGSVRAYFLH